jgi:hypothetical protein
MMDTTLLNNLPKLMGPQQRQFLQTALCMLTVAYCYGFRLAVALLC